MLSKDAADEIKKSNTIWNSQSVTLLRTQMETDFGLSGPYKYSWPKDQAGWDTVTTNLFKVTSNKLIGLLSSWERQLFIDVDDETRQERKTVSKTEQFANGCIDIANRELSAVPSGRDLQSSYAWFAGVRGGLCTSLLFSEVEKGKPQPNIRYYDPEYCQWLEGDNKNIWFCFRNYVSRTYLETKYKDFHIAESSDDDRILTYLIMDEEEWKIASNGLWLPGAGEEHGLGYLPVFIRPVGAMPGVQSENYRNSELKTAWHSIFANDRDLADIESRLLSIGSSIARESGKVKAFGEWDSSLAGANLLEELQKAGFTTDSERNQFILLNKAKGEKFGGLVPTPSMEAVDKFRAIIRGMAIIGMIDPIAFGQMTRSGSGALAMELRAAALEFINPFKKCIEDTFVWVAEECVRQFKKGKFSKLSIMASDMKQHKFIGDIAPGEVEESLFRCQLVPDRLRDEKQELAAAIQEVSSELSSKRSAMLRHNLTEDPDKEMDIMDEELAARDPVFQYDKMAKYFKDQGNERMARYYMALSALTIEKTVKEAMEKALLPNDLVSGGQLAPPLREERPLREAFVEPGRNEPAVARGTETAPLETLEGV